MTFQEMRSRRRDLLSPQSLTDALARADLSGRELAQLAKSSPQTVSLLRQGKKFSVSADLAQRIERCLRMSVGSLFGPEYDTTPVITPARRAIAPPFVTTPGNCPTCGHHDEVAS